MCHCNSQDRSGKMIEFIEFFYNFSNFSLIQLDKQQSAFSLPNNQVVSLFVCSF